MTLERRVTTVVVETLGADDEPWYLCVEEDYEIIDETLPYHERFRTIGYRLSLHAEDADSSAIEYVPVTPDQMLDIAQAFLSAARR